MSENGCIVRSENGYGFLRPGLKTGVENGIFWSEIGSGFGYAGSTPPPKIPRHTPPGPTGSNSEHRRECQSEYQVVVQENIELLFL